MAPKHAIQAAGERSGIDQRMSGLYDTDRRDESVRREAMEVFQSIISAERQALLELMKQTNLISLAGWVVRSKAAGDHSLAGDADHAPLDPANL
ncbi:MAG TPA: hypothetical protein VGF08_13300 [Terriglobales bacterium]|jgi:hypothetical protein